MILLALSCEYRSATVLAALELATELETAFDLSANELAVFVLVLGTLWMTILRHVPVMLFVVELSVQKMEVPGVQIAVPRRVGHFLHEAELKASILPGVPHLLHALVVAVVFSVDSDCFLAVERDLLL